MLKKLPAMSFSVHVLEFLEYVFGKISVLRPVVHLTTKIFVEKKLQHLINLYFCQLFDFPPRPWPWPRPLRSYKLIPRLFYWGLGSQLSIHPTRTSYQQPIGRASNRVVASDLSCGE